MVDFLQEVQRIFTPENIQFLFNGAKTSLFIAVTCLFFGVILGVIAASGKVGRNKFFKFLANIYVELIRGTPMLLQLTTIYLGFPILYRAITGNYISISPLVAAIIAISINSGAYTCELIRGAITSIDKGQWEAGKSLGLSHGQVMKKIILPQAFKRIIPPLANELIVLIKDSSLASTIGAIELMKGASILNTRYYTFFIPICGAALFYLTCTLTISFFTKKLEMRLSESD